jgi:hypothetical protein
MARKRYKIKRYKIVISEEIRYVELVDTKTGKWIMNGWGQLKGPYARKMIRKCAALNAAETRRRNRGHVLRRKKQAVV